MDKLTDTSLMPSGEHKGKAMANVPATYLIWCYDNNKCSKEVRAYVEDNKDVLKKEANKTIGNKKYGDK